MAFRPDPVRRLAPFLLAMIGVNVLAVPAFAADREDAEAALVEGVNLHLNGDTAGARGKLLEAAKEDPDWALLYAVQASVLLSQGDGFGAETAVRRALELKMDPRRVNQLLAHAWLLQGDAQKALLQAQSRAIAPRYTGYAARIRALSLAKLGDLQGAGREFDEAAALNPNSAATWADIGAYRSDVGNISAAIDATSKSIKLNPKRVQSLKLMGMLLRGQYGLTAAIPWFRRALELDSNNLDLMRELAASLGDSGQTVEMLQITRNMLEIDPGNAQAYYLQAVLAARAKKYDLARSLLYRTGGKLDGLPAVMLLNAALELQSGNAEQAIARLEDIVKAQPGNLKAQRLLGAAMWRAGDAQSTINALQTIANRADADSYTLSVIGRAYEAKGNRDLAATYLDRASQPVRGEAVPFEMAGDLTRLARASVGPSDNADFAVPYINKLVLDGNTAEALVQAERLRQRNPGAPAAHVLVGDALMAQGRASEAAKAYRDAANIKFNEPIALRLIEALSKAEDDPAALRVLDLFLSQNPRSVAGLLLAADHFMATAQWTRAIEILDGLKFRLGNRDATVLNSLGWALFNAGNVSRAVESSGAAYAMSPGNAAFADSYGWILYKSGRNREGGAALLEKAVAIAPGHPGLRMHLGQALAGLGRKEEAKTHLRVAASASDFPDAKQAARLLAGL